MNVINACLLTNCGVFGGIRWIGNRFHPCDLILNMKRTLHGKGKNEGNTRAASIVKVLLRLELASWNLRQLL